MLYKTRGIVLSFIKFRESSIITKIYTEEFGLKSYIVNSVRSKNSKVKIALFQPLTLTDLVIYNNEKISLNRISEIKCYSPYQSIPFEIKKSAITMFLTEILNKTLKEDSPNPDLYDFISRSFIYFDRTTHDYQNFHLHFLLQYCSYLGFFPSQISDILGDNKDLVNLPEKTFLEQLITSDYSYPIKANNEIRRNVLQHILTFYRIHTENLGEINSEKILQDILR
jgi:DNA repair protein RecO (recombination protein O)